jgi:inosine/xanthosine triphosphate pyrophosphatase family protein
MENCKKIILATKNPHKKEKLRWIVDGYFSAIEDMPSELEVEENSDSFEGNAQIKALAAAQKNNSYAIATDGGVLIPSLGSNWNGLLTRRFAGGENISDFERIDYLLEVMKDKKGQDRTIIWKESIAIADPKRIIFSTEVDGDTAILQEKYNPQQYKEGIWLCTLCSYPQFGGKNFFELSEEERKYGEISWWKLREKTREFLSCYLGAENDA